MTDLLADTANPVPEKERSECYAMLHASAKRMSLLLDNLLAWARIRARRDAT